MKTAYICYVSMCVGLQWCNVLTFAGGNDRARAQYLAGTAAVRVREVSGHLTNWQIEPMPYVGALGERALFQMAEEAAASAIEREAAKAFAVVDGMAAALREADAGSGDVVPVDTAARRCA